MKKVLGLLLAVFLCTSVFAQGIEFEHGTFAEALAKAKKENKLVFMDCYTSWCGPCKMMTKEIFTQKEVGDFFNAHFVSIKMDMEKGEGIELGKKYGVMAYPTLFFMDTTGKVVHTKVGGGEAPSIIEAGEIACDPSRQIGSLDKKYTDGNRDAKFVVQYIKALQQASRDVEIAPIGKDFVTNCPKEKLATIEGLTIIAYSGAIEFGDDAFNYIVENKEKIVSQEDITPEDFQEIVGGTIYRYVDGISKTGSLDELKAAIEKTKKVLLNPKQQMLEGNWLSTYFYLHKEYQSWFDTKLTGAKNALKINVDNGVGLLVGLANQVALDPSFKEAGLYGKAITEMENLLKDYSGAYAGHFCLACLYKNLNNKERALENINIYIEKDAANGGAPNPQITQIKTEIEAM